MRVLFVSGAFPPMKCGVGDYIALLVKHLSEYSTDVSIGILTSVDSRDNPEPPSHFFPIVKRWDWAAMSQLRQTVNKFNPDIVHLQYPASFGKVFMPNVLPLYCAVKDIAVVQTWHEHPIYSQLINAIPPDTLILVDPRYPTAYRQPYRYAVRHKKCVHIPIGASIPKTELTTEEREILRETFDAVNSRLIVYFGFVHSSKGLEYIFEAADPKHDRLVFISDLDPTDSYHNGILQRTATAPWKGKCFVTGYLSAREVSRILVSADAAVFPFIEGVTPRNSSVLSARLQGTFVVTTSVDRRGYNAAEHTFYTSPENVDELREALDNYAGKRMRGVPLVANWSDIAGQHLKLYQSLIDRK